MKKQIHYLASIFWITVIVALSTIYVNAQIGGRVFKDVNSNGLQELPHEIGVPNVLVKAYLPNQALPISATTNQDGFFLFTTAQIPSGLKVRVEFQDLQGQKSGLKGVDSKTEVQFITSGIGAFATLGILNSVDFCTLDGVEILTPCYVNGDPLVPGGSAGEDIALVKFPYDAEGLAGFNSSPYPDMLAKASDIGAVWGTAYQRRGKQFLVSALVRRHSGLGPLGTGGIYKYDDINGGVTPFVDVKTLGIDTGTDPHTTLDGDKLISNTDPLSIPAMGKTGIGGITFSGDERTLFLVNLFDKKLYSFEVGIPAHPSNIKNIKSFSIPDFCPNGDFRPWGITEYQNKIYVGTVCSAELSQNQNDLKGSIIKFDPVTNSFTLVFEFPLNYKKGISDISGTCPQYDEWNPWTNNFPPGCATTYDPSRGKFVNFVMYPQPILSGIGFDTDGSLIIGLMDRFGLAAGYRNLAPVDDGQLYDGFIGGDLLRAQYNNSTNTYSLENNGISGSLIGVGSGNNEGPGGGEFFGDDTWYFFGNPAHNEITNGAVLVFPQNGTILSSVMDPVNEIYQSGGLRTFDRTNGQLIRGYALYSDVPGTLGKSGGTGDFKASCGPAPIEIGNRVWNDLNFNGVQDPDEPGLPNIVVELYDVSNGNLLVSSTITDGLGQYYFNNSNVSGGILYENDYEIRIDFTQPALNIGATKLASPTDVNSGIGSDLRDSDGQLIGNKLLVSLQTGIPGQTDYSFDFGIYTCNVITPDYIQINPNCIVNTGIIIINSPLGTKYSYSIQNNVFQLNHIFNDVNPGNYFLKVKDELGCVSDSILVAIPNPPSKPTKPILSATQPTCLVAAGSITVTSPMGSGLSYSLDGVNFGNTSGVFSGLSSGTYAVWARNSQGCISDTSRITILPQPLSPTKPILSATQPTCLVATGSITVTSPMGSGLSYSLDGVNFGNTSGVFSGLSSGTYAVWVRNSQGCISDTSRITILPQPLSPTKPILSATQSTCLVATGSITVTSPMGSGLSYSLDGLGFGNTSGVFSGLSSGTYAVWARNSQGCISDTSRITILPQPVSPTKPILSATQPTCLVATGSITVTSPMGSGLSYSLDGVGFGNTSGVFSGLSSRTYAVWARNSQGCISDTSRITILTQPLSPTKPILSATQPTCLVATGSITVTSPLGSGLSYSLDGVGFGNTSRVFSGLSSGTYAVWVRNSQGCISDTSRITIFPQPLSPTKPILSATQPTCLVATGSITVTSPMGLLLSYSLDGVNFGNTSGVFNSLQSGTYSIWAKNPSGCISDSARITINPVPQTPPTPVLTAIHPNCSVATGTINVVSPVGVGYSYSLNGLSFTNTSGQFTGLFPGTYSVWAKNGLGCISYFSRINITPNTQSVDAGSDKEIYVPANSVQLAGTPAGGTWSVSVENHHPSIINNSGLVQQLNRTGEYNFIYSVGSCRDTARVTVVCIKPTLTIGNISCNGSFYEVEFYSSSSNIAVTAGNVVGNKITGIPLGISLTVVASISNECQTTLMISSPQDCGPNCVLPKLSVGQPLCKGNTYSVSYTKDLGVITVNAGVVLNDSIINIPIGTNLIISSTNGSHSCSTTLTIESPMGCQNECTEPGVSLSGPICITSGNHYEINFIKNSNVSISINYGSIVQNKITMIPINQALIINAQQGTCPVKIITIQPPTNCKPNCKPICIPLVVNKIR